MTKSAAIFVIMATVTTVTAPVTRQNDIRLSTTLRQHEGDLRPEHYTDAAGSDVTTENDVTVDATMTTTTTVNATERPRWTYFPFQYDSQLGWYTAAVISGLILVFYFCDNKGRAKRAVIDYWEARYRN